jgi:hypothetical protein
MRLEGAPILSLAILMLRYGLAERVLVIAEKVLSLARLKNGPGSLKAKLFPVRMSKKAYLIAKVILIKGAASIESDVKWVPIGEAEKLLVRAA